MPKNPYCKPMARNNEVQDQSSVWWVFKPIDHESMSWKENLLSTLFDEATVQNLVQIKLPESPQDDVLLWTMNSNGELTVKQAYLLEQGTWPPQNSPLTADQRRKIWTLKIHKRFKVLLWKIIWNLLPISMVISSRPHMETQASCILPSSRRRPGTPSHSFFLISNYLGQSGMATLNQ